MLADTDIRLVPKRRTGNHGVGVWELITVKLRVRQGTLKRQQGGSAGLEVELQGKRFVIGSATDCQMRCPSTAISPHHCEIYLEGPRYFVRDLGSASGTYVNGVKLADSHLLANGDQLRVGKLEFEAIVENPPVPAPHRSPRPSDSVGDTISEMLVAADREDRAQRLEDPAKRRFAVQTPESRAEDKAPQAPVKKKAVPPPKKPPMKLPPPPKIAADSTVQAAEQVLKKIFDKPKK